MPLLPTAPTRRGLLLAGAVGAVGALGATGVAVSRSRAPGWADAAGRLRIATGNTGAVFDRYGRALAAEVERAMPRVTSGVVPTGGSFGNLRAVLDGDAEVAFSLGDSAAQAIAGTAPLGPPADLVALTRLYDSFLQVLVRADADIAVPADLVGRRVTAGEADSGTRVVATRTLEALGVAPDDVELVDLALEDGVARLASGQVDALAFVSGFPIPALVEAGRRVPLRALDVGDAVGDLVGRWGPQYVAGPLPAGPYGLPAPVATVSVKTYLVARPDLADDLAHGFTAVVFERQAALGSAVPDVRQPTAAAGIFTQPVPLHPGSLQWFRERDRRAT
ncbi:TAXI family TRAP transporter solute-binding subunit [Nocardioides sp. ChNu-153]|uniref:TAXI family TRAP transporter solute-binding subunit n=1 Tax=unclassified Nocardioides TaxID=2615069 RepID=UPI002407028D|nr:MULTISPECIES: TAXI family TRAP transporter solute-binding subunit [unclassified Nocardioides]MDF9715532.1 TAXI family TRAP transporter solute-binding subunit [Nocardioides sp. ChNu-99]MDN7120713.1 TAXI family TRAP transporter solute-binding subunit [Nocardioides sp. ChNu-153]